MKRRDTEGNRVPARPTVGPARSAGARVAAVAVAAAAVALMTTSGAPYVPPSWLAIVLGASAVAAAVHFATAGRAPRLVPWVSVIAALCAGIAAGHVLFRAGMPRVHDILHLWGIWAYGRCVSEGSLLPLWTPYLGAGMPVVLFYGALNFLLSLPGVLLGLAPMGAWKLEILTAHVLTSLSVLAAARLLGAGWGASAVAAVAGAFAPWRLAVFGYRGALGEANAFVFMPLAAAGALRLLRRPSLPPAIVFAAAVVGLILTHPISLFTLAISMIPAAGLWLAIPNGAQPREPDGRWTGLGPSRPMLGPVAVVLAASAAAGVAAVAWLPVVAEQRYTAVRETTADNPFYRYDEQGVAPAALVRRGEWDRLLVSIPESARRERGGDAGQMPFYFGAVLAGLALASGWWSSRRDAWALSAGVLLPLVLSTATAAHLLGSLPPFPTLRFPFRFLSPATVIAALGVGLGADALLRRPGGRLRTAPLWIAIAALAWDGAPFTGAADWIAPYRGVVHWWEPKADAEHWDGSREAVPVDLPASAGVCRVFNLEMPPSDYRTAIDSFFPGYYEWLTPEIYRRYWSAKDATGLGAAGVRLYFSAARRDPVPIPGRPYASLEAAGGSRIPVEPARVTRAPGRVTVEVDAPPGGAVLVVLEQAFPGWTARVNGGETSVPASREGFLSVALPAGPAVVEFRFGLGTPAGRAGLAVSLLTIVAIAAGALVLLRGRASPRHLAS